MHISVLLDEVINGLNLKEDGIYVDCTLGYAGHSSAILKKITRGCLFAIDQDSDAILYSEKKLSEISSNFCIIESNFVNLKEELNKRSIESVDGFLFDLGVSSVQLDEADRGFSYHSDAKLDMRMSRKQKLSAYEVVNEYSESELAKIFFLYGEEKYSKSVAKNIIKHRSVKPIETTLELSDIITNSMPFKARREKHPARKVFQAIRIEVNNELGVLEQSIKDALSMLNIGGRIAVITFHSLEDRIIKNIFKEATDIDIRVKGLPDIPEKYLPDYALVNRKAVQASIEELEANHRSRSAKLRIIERIK